MKIQRIPRLAFAAALCFLFFGFAHAQGTSGTVQGVISDPNGEAVPGADVSIAELGPTAAFSRSTTTDDRGRFTFSNVPPGSFQLKASRSGFNLSQTTLNVSIDQILVADMILEVGTAQMVVSFEGTDKTAGPTPEIRTSNNAARLAELPRRTTIGSLFKTAPFVRNEALAGGYQFGGASGADNTFYIDGQETTNFRSGLQNVGDNLPFELVQEVQTRDDLVNAEYSGAIGGSVSVATQGGNNRLRGNVGFSITPAALQGSPAPILNRFGSTAGQFEFFQPRKDGGFGAFPAATVGGAIKKDKLWFFAGYAPQFYSTKRTIDYFSSSNPASRTVTESITYESNVRTEAMFARLDSRPVDNLQLSGSFLYNPTIQDGGLPLASEGLGGAPQVGVDLRGAAFLATRGGRQNSNLVNGQATWTPTRKLVINVRAGRGFLNEKLDSYGIPRTTRFICSASGTPSNVPGSGCQPGFQNVANNSVVDYDVSKRTTFAADGAFYGIDLAGRHDIKFGYQYNRVVNDVSEGYVNTGIVQLLYGRAIDVTFGLPVTPTPGNLGSGFLQRFGTVGTDADQARALFVQDHWTIANRLTISAGVRFEDEELADFGAAPNVKFGLNDKIAPRIAASYDVFGNGKTKFFGSWGRFYDRLKFNALRGDFGITSLRDFFEILPSRGAAYSNYTFARVLGSNPTFPGGQCPITNPTGWSVCQFNFAVSPAIVPAEFLDNPGVDPLLKPARTSTLTIGGEQRISGGLRISGRYIRQRLDRAIEDLGVFNQNGSLVFFLGNPGEGLSCTVASNANEPCTPARRNFDAFEVIADKRGPRYFFNASYTFSRLKGNYSGLAASDEAGRVSPNTTRTFDDPQSPRTATGSFNDGPLATDRPHVFKAFGGYTQQWSGANKTIISAFTTIQSGTPLTTVYSLYSNASAILNGRGDLGRTSRFFETDLMLTHRWNFLEDRRFTLEPYVIVLNLFDRRGELGRQTSISTSNFTSTTLASGGCTTCASQAAVYNTLARSGISQFVQNVLNTRGVSATGIRSDYNVSNLFQTPRYVRFGVRLWF